MCAHYALHSEQPQPQRYSKVEHLNLFWRSGVSRSIAWIVVLYYDTFCLSRERIHLWLNAILRKHPARCGRCLSNGLGIMEFRYSCERNSIPSKYFLKLIPKQGLLIQKANRAPQTPHPRCILNWHSHSFFFMTLLLFLAFFLNYCSLHIFWVLSIPQDPY